TASTYPGSYRVHSILTYNTSVVLAENTVPFTIVPVVNIASVVVTDKTAYAPHEDVSITFNTKNNGTNYIVPQLDVRAKVTDASNNIQFTDDKNIANLLPGATVTLTSAWNTGLNLPGDYNVVVETYLNGNLILSKSVSFKINTAMTITGSAVVTPAAVLAGKAAQVDYTIQSLGNAVVNSLPITLLVVDPDTQAVMNTQAGSIAIGVNATVSGRFTVSTQGYSLKTYVAALQYALGGNTKTLANSTFTVKDGTPPVVTIVSPASGGIYNSTIDLAVSVTDDGSGVDRVEYQIDGGTWKTMPSVNRVGGVYSTAWVPVFADNGSHNINFRATDKAGNFSTSAPVSFTIQMDSTPPVTVIDVGSPKHQTTTKVFVSGGTLFTLSATDNMSGTAKTEYSIDGGQLISYAPFRITAEGPHDILFRSVDNASNIEPDNMFKIIVDNTPPTGTLSINDNAEYSRTSSVTLAITASDGTGSGVAKMCISNTDSCSAWEDYAGTKAWTLSPEDGTKTVFLWLKDNLGNADLSPCSASITLDTLPPALTVSTLSEGGWTNNDLLNVAGQVTDNAGIQQLTVNSAAVTTNPDGTFSHPVTLHDGPNTVVVDATDLAGNQTADSRTIYLDRLAPTITITTPADNTKTNQSPIDVTGTVDEDSSVTIRMNSSDPVAAFMSGNAFSLPVIPFYGINTIEVTATDLATNTSTVKRTVTFDNLSPSLSVTEPEQDIKTNKADMIIKGETTDMTVVAVTINMDGDIYTPVLSEGKFEQPVAFSEQGLYRIGVTVTDEAGNSTTVQRNVLYDATAPTVTMDPVTSPTSQSSQVLTGTMEAGAIVSATCPTATVGTVTYPTATTWKTTLSDMKNGNNTITVNAMDDIGNISNSITATIAVESFSYPAFGSFVIGDKNAAIGSSVTFWGSQWARSNTMSDGLANASFKGFADGASTTPPTCGGTWTASPGNSSSPPGSIPTYMAVIVSSNVTKSGSTISGNIKKIVIVKTNPGYASDPGHPGTGTVVGVVCQ
ncbi:MAG TPA: Ig-like domain-containing protein, partial [Thermodesulfovibrionales bacterium]|nr:Ig-like domain-containing protein [Thermodesulfovibrionales bacterium]